MSIVDIQYGNFSFVKNHLPTPAISINTTYDTTPNGKIIGSTSDITLNGQIYASGINGMHWHSTAPSVVSTSTSMNTVFNKIKTIKAGFNVDYQSLKIYCGSDTLSDITSTSSGTTIVKNISFNNQTDNLWNEVVDYTIELSVYGTGFYYDLPQEVYVSSIEDSYSIQNKSDFYTRPLNTTPTSPYPNGFYPSGTGVVVYSIDRTIRAIGKNTHRGALAEAKRCVSGLLTDGKTHTKIENIFSDLQIFNRTISINASETEGEYSITQNFEAVSGWIPPYIETYTLNNSVDQSLQKTVTIQGNIQGMNNTLGQTSSSLYKEIKENNYLHEYMDNLNIAYNNAKAGLSVIKNQIWNRATGLLFPSGKAFMQDYTSQSTNNVAFKRWLVDQGDRWLNPIPLSIDVTHNKANGSIDYTYTYNSRPYFAISGALTESLDIDDSYGLKQVLSVDIMKGNPVLQSLNTYTIPSRTVKYSANFGLDKNPLLSGNIIESGLINYFDPASGDLAAFFNTKDAFIYSWVTQLSQSLNINDNSFEMIKTWNYEIRHTGNSA